MSGCSSDMLDLRLMQDRCHILARRAAPVESLVDALVVPSLGSERGDGEQVSDTCRRTPLLGRTAECALLEGLIDDIRRGESRSLVLRGEPGIGKTALVEHLVESASDLNVVRAVGVESEMELAYASLHQLSAPLLDRLERLPAPQRQALDTIFALSAGPTPDRFLVGLAELGLFSEVAAVRPLGRVRN